MNQDENTSSLKEMSLRELVAARLNERWEVWAAAHPHLAQVIDRTKLIESTVARLRDDPAYQAAITQAGLDEARLQQSQPLVELTQRLVTRLLPL